MKIVSWNIGRREAAWRVLLEMEADVALLQEATPPPPDVADKIKLSNEPWLTKTASRSVPWRCAVAQLSDKFSVKWIPTVPIEAAGPGDIAVSRPGTLAVASVTPADGDPILVVSMYSVWEKPSSLTGSNWIYADASAHRLISDLSCLIGRQRGHRIIAAGDFNILHGYGEEGSPYWRRRYATVFARFSALGLSFAGPRAPQGRQADPWPLELPPDSENVPTFHSSRQSPLTATRQLDFVFASKSLIDNIQVRALNEPAAWGPSDHCRILIEVD